MRVLKRGLPGNDRVCPPETCQHAVSIFGITPLLPVDLVRPVHEVVMSVEDVLEALCECRGHLSRHQALDDEKPVFPILLYLLLAELADLPDLPDARLRPS